MAPAAPLKRRACLAQIDDNSNSNIESYKTGDAQKLTAEKNFGGPPRKRRLTDTSMTSAFMFKNFGIKPLPTSPSDKSKKLVTRKSFGFQGKRLSSFSSFSASTSSSPVDVFDFENDSGFFDGTPENSISSRSLLIRSRSNGFLGRRSCFTSTPHSEAFPPSFFLFERSKLIQSQQTDDHFSELPDEMILRILKWLPKTSLGRLAQVSQRLQRLTSDESLWRRIDLTGKFLESENMNVIMSRKPVYLRLSRSKLNEPTDLGHNFSAPQLTYLDLSMVVISAPALKVLLGMCSSLVKLSLEHIEVGHDALVAMGVFAHSIDTLNLAMCYDLPGKPFAAFLAQCSKLKSLNLGCVKHNWTRESLMDIINSLPTGLLELNMSGLRNTMVDTHVQILTERCTDLRALDLSDCIELTMMSLEAISNLEQIHHLGMSRCYSIEMSAFIILAQMKSLRFLEVYMLLKESSIKSLETHLRHVRINNCPFSPIARPTFGFKRSSIWAQRVRD